jgi:valyl-tRNA synthetase
VLAAYAPSGTPSGAPPTLAPADRWLLARLRRLVERMTTLFTEYDYATARAEAESFFWATLADNYLELAKLRLYDASDPQAAGARYALRTTLLTILKLFAPFLPYVTEEIYTTLFADEDSSIHRAAWPTLATLPPDEASDEVAERAGDTLVAIATAVRRYKSENGLSLGRELARLQIATDDASLANWLQASATDLSSVTRAATVEVGKQLDPSLQKLAADGGARIALQP